MTKTWHKVTVKANDFDEALAVAMAHTGLSDVELDCVTFPEPFCGRPQSFGDYTFEYEK